MTDAFFRAGVGAVVLDDARRILRLRRKGAHDGAWQLPQGGIARGEAPLDALYRELQEEVGLGRADVEVLATSRDWLAYELPAQFRNDKVGWGQVQRWYLCRLLAPRGRVVPDQVEFEAAEWVPAERLLRDAAAFRVPVYERLVAEFALRDAG